MPPKLSFGHLPLLCQRAYSLPRPPDISKWHLHSADCSGYSPRSCLVSSSLSDITTASNPSCLNLSSSPVGSLPKNQNHLFQDKLNYIPLLKSCPYLRVKSGIFFLHGAGGGQHDTACGMDLVP